VRALFDDASIVNDHDPVSVGDGGQAMRDDEGCATLQQPRLSD
jgi:hypothetical protein